MHRTPEGTCTPIRAALALLAITTLPGGSACAQTTTGQRAAAPALRAAVDQYCVVCHNQKTSTAGVSLEKTDFGDAGGNAPILERVLRKVRTGEMPPAGMPRPAAAPSAELVKSLEGALDQAAAANPNP